MLQVLLELLEALKEEEEPAKVLLFSYSTALLDILEPFAQSLAYNYLRLDGKTRDGFFKHSSFVSHHVSAE